MRMAALVIAAAACSRAPEPHWCAYAKPGGSLPTTCTRTRADCERTARNLPMFYDAPCVSIAPVYCFTNPKGKPNCYPTQRDCVGQLVEFYGSDRKPGDDDCLASP